MMLIQPSRISRYAHTFIGAVVDADGEASIDLRTANLRAFAEVWLESAELQKALRSPSIPASERRAVIASLCHRIAIAARRSAHPDLLVVEGRRDQRQAPVHRLKDVIEEQCHSDHARDLDDARCEVRCDTQPAVKEENSVHAAVSTRSKKRAPAILALRDGDASAIRFIITPRSYSFHLMRAIESRVHANQIRSPNRGQQYRCDDRQRLSCCAGLFLPSLNVHAHHEQP